MTWTPWSGHGVTGRRGGHRNRKHTNAHRPCYGAGGGARSATGGGEITSNQLRVTSYKLPVPPKRGNLITRDYDRTGTGGIVTITLESVFVAFLGCYMHIGWYIT